MVRSMTTRFVWAAGAVMVAAGAFAQLAPGAARGTFPLNVSLPMRSTPGPCPAGHEVYVCALRTSGSAVPGLGEVSVSYRFFVDPAQCPGTYHILATMGQLTVEGKGTINFSLAASLACVETALQTTEAFTITGGSGTYAGASGSGTLKHEANYTSDGGAAGTDTWTGSLTVPGHEFDLTPPTISGAVDKVVRTPKYKVVHLTRRKTKRVLVKYVRVGYQVTASDAVDGAVPPTCKPSSGSRFRVGRTTTVACSATDTSANAATAQFAVTVKTK